MKYNTIGTSGLNGEQGKKSTFTIYADMDIRPSTQTEIANSEMEVATVRAELETVQKALRAQTRRCRQLVTEYTKRLQLKEQQYQSERSLREDQLAKVLRALIIFEARLRQEQKYIGEQLKEKDQVIRKQGEEIKRLSANGGDYCKNCDRYYSTTINAANAESAIDSSSEYVVTDYQSSNFESLDSSSDVYTTISENSCDKPCSGDDRSERSVYVKNRAKDSLGRRTKKAHHRPSVGTYFEVLKMRSERADSVEDPEPKIEETSTSSQSSPEDKIKSKISDAISAFEGETNDNNWYASASDQEDEEQRDVYRNNPVLECVNQILLQNINDSMNSPPKTPNVERKSMKKVKFSDEEAAQQQNNPLTKENVQEKQEKEKQQDDYYETPIQKIPNFYETPQSIYSNDYEQILSKCNESFSNSGSENQVSDKNTNSEKHFYVDLDKKTDEKSRPIKMPRTPPALPPKPANLVLKYKHQTIPEAPPSEVPESEPDYCSISELNLPPANKSASFQKISIAAEVHCPSTQELQTKVETKKKVESEYDPVIVNDNLSNMVVRKCVEKMNIQLAKQTPIRPDVPTIKLETTKVEVIPIKVEVSPKRSKEPEIPKLPQVSEIIIPDEHEGEKKSEERITHDNYVQNNTQIMKLNQTKRPIMMGVSVSNLITGFNNQQILSDIKKKPERAKSELSFEHNVDKSETFDLSQNFEEFKLDDCEIEEYNMSEEERKEEEAQRHKSNESVHSETVVPRLSSGSVELFKKHLEAAKGCEQHPKSEKAVRKPDANYEHFLECTGLSTKAIITPARLLTNHKNVLKPKDIKLRSRVRANNLFERHSTNSIKYWSEPFI